jgi:Carboxypeptidase regulatory-like domain
MGRLLRSSSALVALLAACLVGCGERSNPSVGTTYPLKGKVMLPDGKPLPKVRVVFTGPVSNSAVTESDGTFALPENSGLPAGDYKVHLEITESKGSNKKAVLPFPGRYSDEDASGLNATVKPDGPNDFDFKLTQGEAKAK